MKVFFDHNMSPALGRAVRELFKDTHQVTLLRERFPLDISDVEMIGELSREGHWVFISEDRRITRNRAEYAAFRASRLVGIFLSSGLHKAPVAKKMERLLACWQAIERTAESVTGGAVFELSMKTNQLKQLQR